MHGHCQWQIEASGIGNTRNAIGCKMISRAFEIA